MSNAQAATNLCVRYPNGGAVNCVDSTGTSANVGIGTINRPVVYTSSTTAGPSGVLFDNGTNIGIGSINPGKALDVQGSIRATTDIGIGTYSVCTTSGNCPAGGGGTAAGGLNAVQYNSPVGTFAGSEAVFSMNGTNVGIGTTNGIKLLDVRGAAIFSGNVGIGTTITSDFANNPTRLMVSGTGDGNADITAVENTTSGSAYPFKALAHTTADDQSCFINTGMNQSCFYNHGTSTGGSTGGITNVDLAGISFSGAANVVIDNSSNTPIIFTQNGGEKFRIHPGGNVGIGSSAPGTILDVVGDMRLIGGTSFYLTSDKKTFLGASAATIGDMLFYVNGVEKDRINQSGNVGIGSTAPGQALDIQGRMRQSTAPTLCSAGNYPLGVDGSLNAVSCTAAGAGGANYWQLTNVGIGTGVPGNTTNVGIGTVTYGSTFTVLGNVGIGTNGSSLFVTSAAPSGGLIVEKNVGIGTINPQSSLSVGGSNGVAIGAAYSTLTAGTGNLIVSGNIGIGSTTPGTALDVFSSMRVLNSGHITTEGVTATGATGSGKFVFDGTPTLITPVIGAATGTSLTTTGNIGIGTTLIADGGLIVRGVNVGIGTDHPGVALDVNGSLRLPGAGNVGIGTFAPQSLFVIKGGDIRITGTAPSLSSCGTSPSITGNDNSFRITVGTTASGCTATFNTAKTNTPSCVCAEEVEALVNALTYTPSTTAVTFSQTSMDSKLVDCICVPN